MTVRTTNQSSLIAGRADSSATEKESSENLRALSSKKLLEKALSFTPIKDLYEKANSTPSWNNHLGPWTIEWVKKTSSGFEAECDLTKRKINLASDLSDEKALSYFVFELTNAVQAKEHLAIWKKACSGQAGGEEYAKESERIEYEGTLLHHRIMSSIIKNMGWMEWIKERMNPTLDIYRYHNSSFEQYWECIKDSPHTNYYRNEFRRKLGENITGNTEKNMTSLSIISANSSAESRKELINKWSSPSASVARAIEAIILTGKNSDRFLVQGSCFVLSRAISAVVFPIFLSLELVFKRIPILLSSFTNFSNNFDKVVKYALSILFSPLGLYCPSSVSGFFLQRSSSNTVVPFGVETQYGKQVDGICYPTTSQELQAIVMQAKKDKKQISIIGAGMSQGTQTTPTDPHQVVIHTKYLNKIELSKDKKTVHVGSGTTWEQLQIALNKEGKSSIVKQASDPFSIGGSIGINCHGWAHKDGAIASTVESLQVIDASGELKTLTPKDEQFGCFFGTLGYFGVIVGVTLRVVDNDHLIEQTKEIGLDEFSAVYQGEIKNKETPLFGGRLTLDQLEGDPLRNICMVYYTKDEEANRLNAPGPTPNFFAEPSLGLRIERVFLQAIAHLSNYSATRLLNYFWNRERASMLAGRKLTRNEAIHPPINSFNMLRNSNLHSQWLQEYFVTEEHLPDFLRFLGKTLKENGVRLVNATIRPTPKDSISILPYAEQDRHAVVLCFAQEKTEKAIEKTRQWIEKVNAHLIAQGDVYYQAYMPYATREQFETCYGKERVENLRRKKLKYDPDHLFGNAHTSKYYGAASDAVFDLKAPQAGISAYLFSIINAMRASMPYATTGATS